MLRCLLTVSLLLLGACVRLADEPEVWECEEHADCPSGMRCAYSREYCIPAGVCFLDFDCDDGMACRAGACQARECSYANDEACQGYRCDYDDTCLSSCWSHNDCAAGYQCNEERECIPGCEEDSECPAHQACSEGQCSAKSCVADEECGAYACSLVLGECVQTCSSSSGCAHGALCSDEGRCEVCTACGPYACLYDLESPTCASYCDDNEDCAPGRECDPQTGECYDPEACDIASCGGYRCAGDTCATSCASWSDCAEGYLCDEATSTCVAFECASKCGAYGCDEYGECRASCTGPSDCAPNARCDDYGTCQSADAFGCFDDDCAPYRCDGLGGCTESCSDSSQCHEVHYCYSDGSCG